MLFQRVCLRKIRKDFLQFLLNLKDIMNWSLGKDR